VDHAAGRLHRRRLVTLRASHISAHRPPPAVINGVGWLLLEWTHPRQASEQAINFCLCGETAEPGEGGVVSGRIRRVTNETVRTAW